MIEDHGSNIQQEDLIGDDVASDLAAAMNDGQHPGDSHGVVTTPDEPAVDTAPAAATIPSRPPVPVASHDDSATDDKGTGDDLHAIKHEALKELGPLVEHIDQTPEDRFDTLMMMIRASDDETLIKPAYEAAQKITDNNKKAKALLDIVNEVNYLTRPVNSDGAS